ncbi:MAG: hypothetical protein JRF34_10920, partial [Deltaproteobacteria bacterium]|nr:hypothetical protein [Deltaproteobacteria bacterium]
GADAKGVDEEKANNKIKAIDGMIEAFGGKRLNTLYTDLAFRLLRMIAGDRQLNLQRGRGEIWAAAIIYVIAQLNFLFDPEMEICISPDDICGFFGTKKSTVSSKAGLIRKELDLYYGHPDLCAPELVEMFSVYETPEGFLIPGNLVGESISSRELGTEYEAPRKDKKRHPDKEVKKNPKPAKEDGENKDRQLKLFDDH